MDVLLLADEFDRICEEEMGPIDSRLWLGNTNDLNFN